MFNIGLIELIIIIFFVLVLIKPKDFPKIFRQVGLFYRNINQHLSNLKFEFSELDTKKNTKKKK